MNLVTKSILAIALGFAGVSYAQDTPKIKQINIDDMKYSGSGCRQGSAKSIVTNSRPGSPYADYFQLVYDDFEVNSGEGTSRRDRTKTCDIQMAISFPEGYRFRLSNVSYDGYAELTDSAIHGKFQTEIGEPFGDSTSVTKKLKGPYEGSYDHKQTRASTRGFKSNCEGKALFTIKSIISIRGKAKEYEGKITKDISSGMLENRYRMIWERC